MQILGNLRLVS
ncbi:unnamed protein product, partial [Rotaria sordida]